jgi:Na+/proline symporter
MRLQQIDLWIVFAYLFLMLGIAFWQRKFAAASLENFFLGGRKVPGWLNGVSYTAALVSPDAATGYGGLAITTGAFICWWYLSRFGLALFLGAVLFAVFWRRLNLFTTLEFYDLRFQPRAAAAMRLWIAGRTALIAMTAWTGITLLATCKIMGPALELSKIQTLLLVVPVSFIYVFLSGYRGVVISNLIQMTIFFAGALMLACFTLDHFGGPHALSAALSVAKPEMLQNFPPANHTVFPLAAALAWLVGQSVGYGGDAAPMGGAVEGQRILSSRTPGEAVTMYLVAALTMFILLLLVTLPCIGAALIWPELQEVGADRELVYGRLMKALLPAGAMGLMVAAMLAAAMSTVADNLNFGSQVLVSDIYRRWLVRDATERHYLWAGKVGMLIILGLSLAVVFNVRIITDVAVFMLQLSAAELPANWAQWWWWRFNGKARIAASFGGAAIFCLVVLGPKGLVALGIADAAKLILPWWWQTFLVMGLTTILWVTVALVTKPDPEALLNRFYQRARPLGWWGPFHSHHADSNPSLQLVPILRGGLIALVGAGATSLLILGLSDAWFGHFPASAVALAVAGVLFIAFHKLAKAFLNFLSLRANASEVVSSPNSQVTHKYEKKDCSTI